MTSIPQNDRRRFLKGAAVAGGAAWVAPIVSTFNTPAGAASVLAQVRVTPGGAVLVEGNNAVTVPLPATGGGDPASYTKYLVVVAQIPGAAGALPLWNVSTGWNTTTIVTNVAGSPAMAVYQSSSPTPSAPAFIAGNEANGRWIAVVIGFSVGSTVTASTMNAASNGTTGITFNSATAASPATWVAIGTSTQDNSGTNWEDLSSAGYTTLVDHVGGNNKNIDLFVALYNPGVLTTIPQLTGVTYGDAADTAKSVHVGVS